MEISWIGRTLGIWSVLLIVTACGGGDSKGPETPPLAPSQTPKEQIAALEASGGIPKLDRTAATTGLDSNSNGVRDDVDAYLAAKYSVSLERAAATQFASATQAAIAVNKSDLAAVKAVSTRSSRAVNCIYSRFTATGASKQPASVVEEIRAVSTNTKQRLLAYLAYSKALDGTSTSLPNGDTCE